MSRARSRTADLTAGDASVDPASFRDPSGFVFRRGGTLYRQVDASFAEDWDAFIGTGLYDALAGDRLVVEHEPVALELAARPGAHAVIRPRELEFISYPYEWSFGQLKAAALLTLDLQKRAIDDGMTLRDASAFNVQFDCGRPILIDSLSFERYQTGAPWAAYRQFCEHFLGPLALMAYRDPRLSLLLRDFVDGVPLDLVSNLLPRRTRLRFGLASHLHLHARASRAAGGRGDPREPPAERGRKGGERRVSALGQRALLDSLRTTVRQLRWDPRGTEWADYAERTSYSETATRSKHAIVERMLRDAGGARVWDLGANTGAYSGIAARLGRRVIAFDLDPAAVERHWRAVAQAGTEDVLPLVLDLTNPSPAVGWALRERRSLVERADADVVMALALVHHLAISKNVPLPDIGRFFARLGAALVVEFVPKDDPMVGVLLASRRDVFPDYSLDGFRRAFADEYEVLDEARIEDSGRMLFRMARRSRVE